MITRSFSRSFSFGNRPGAFDPNADPYAQYVVSLIRANDSPGTLIPVDSVNNGITWLASLSSTWQGTVSTPTVIDSGSYKCSTSPLNSQPSPRIYSSFSSLFPSNQSTTFECSYLISSTSITKSSVLADLHTGSNTDWFISYNRGILVSPGVWNYPQNLDFALYDSPSQTTTYYSLDFSPAPDTVFSIAVSSVYTPSLGGQTHYVFVNGILKLTIGNPKARFATGRLSIGGGSLTPSGASSSRVGQLYYWDESRFTTGVARYTSDYTLSLPFPNP